MLLQDVLSIWKNPVQFVTLFGTDELWKKINTYAADFIGK